MTVGLGAGLDVAVGAVMSVLRMAAPTLCDQFARMREMLRRSIRTLLDVQGSRANLLSLDGEKGKSGNHAHIDGEGSFSFAHRPQIEDCFTH